MAIKSTKITRQQTGDGQTTRVIQEQVVEEQPSYSQAPPAEVADPARRIMQFLLNTVELFLLARLVLRLVGASASSPAVNFIYRLTEPLISAFRGIAPTTAIEGATVEWTTIIAMAAYAALFYILAMLVNATRPDYETRSDLK